MTQLSLEFARATLMRRATIGPFDAIERSSK
jgi:hypothetical protein